MESAEFLVYPSKKTKYFIHAIYSVSMLMVAILPIFFLWKIGVWVALMCFWLKERSLYAMHNTKQNEAGYVRFWHIKNKIFTLEMPNGMHTKGILKADSYKCPWFIILRLKLMTVRQTRRKGQTSLKIQPKKFLNLSLKIQKIKESYLFPKRLARTYTLFIAKDSLTEVEYRMLASRLLSY